jgi:hypothetical protein
MVGHPEYKEHCQITVNQLNKLSIEEILYSFLIIHTRFDFPKTTKYPSLPCFVDEICTVYPLQGEGF